MAAVVTENWNQVIAACDLESWKEALTAILTHTRGEEFSSLCGMNTIILLIKTIFITTFLINFLDVGSNTGLQSS